MDINSVVLLIRCEVSGLQMRCPSGQDFPDECASIDYNLTAFNPVAMMVEEWYRNI
jgi:hypothetical protein